MAQPLAPSFRLRLLGTPGITGAAGGPAGPLQGQALALLAVLACAGERGIARDKLLTLLWPESPASPASHRLSQLAHWIRRTLGSAGLITGTSDLRLDQGEIGCDLWEFEERPAGRTARAGGGAVRRPVPGWILPRRHRGIRALGRVPAHGARA